MKMRSAHFCESDKYKMNFTDHRNFAMPCEREKNYVDWQLETTDLKQSHLNYPQHVQFIACFVE